LTLSFFHCKTGGYFLKSIKKSRIVGAGDSGRPSGIIGFGGATIFFWDSGTATTRNFEGDGSKAKAKANPKMMMMREPPCPSKRMGAKANQKMMMMLRSRAPARQINISVPSALPLGVHG